MYDIGKIPCKERIREYLRRICENSKGRKLLKTSGLRRVNERAG
jgi:hypothetical protein